jgi:hypothetical protein
MREMNNATWKNVVISGTFEIIGARLDINESPVELRSGIAASILGKCGSSYYCTP